MARDTFPYWPSFAPRLAASIPGRQLSGMVQDLAVNLIPEYDDTEIATSARAGVIVPKPDAKGYSPVYGQRAGGLFAYLDATMTPVPEGGENG